jgi:hypothetical protein
LKMHKPFNKLSKVFYYFENPINKINCDLRELGLIIYEL